MGNQVVKVRGSSMTLSGKTGASEQPLNSSATEAPPLPMPDGFLFEKGVCALEYWEPVKLLKEGSISDIHSVRRRSKRIKVRYKKKRDVMKFAKNAAEQADEHYEGERKDDTRDLYVLKSVMKDKVGEDLVLEEMRREIETMSSLDHPYVAKLYEAYERRRHIYLVMEYCPGGDLSEVGKLSENECASLVHQILSAVSYLHAHNVVHRDRK